MFLIRRRLPACVSWQLVRRALDDDAPEHDDWHSHLDGGLRSNNKFYREVIDLTLRSRGLKLARLGTEACDLVFLVNEPGLIRVPHTTGM